MPLYAMSGYGTWWLHMRCYLGLPRFSVSYALVGHVADQLNVFVMLVRLWSPGRPTGYGHWWAFCMSALTNLFVPLFAMSGYGTWWLHMRCYPGLPRFSVSDALVGHVACQPYLVSHAGCGTWWLHMRCCPGLPGFSESYAFVGYVADKLQEGG